MENSIIQKMIYNQKYLANYYHAIQFEKLENDILYHIDLLNRYYQEYNTSSYDPIVIEPDIKNTMKESILYLMTYITKSLKLFMKYDEKIIHHIHDVLTNHYHILNELYISK